MKSFGTIITGVPDQGVIVKAFVLQCFHHLSYRFVDLSYIGQVLLEARIRNLLVALNKPGITFHGTVRFMKPESDKEGLTVISMITQPLHQFVGHDLSRESFHEPHPFSIQEKVVRVFVTGTRHIAGGKQVVVAIVVHTRLTWMLAKTVILKTSRTAPIIRILLREMAQVPFSKVSGLIATLSQELR